MAITPTKGGQGYQGTPDEQRALLAAILAGRMGAPDIGQFGYGAYASALGRGAIPPAGTSGGAAAGYDPSQPFGGISNPPLGSSGGSPPTNFAPMNTQGGTFPTRGILPGNIQGGTPPTRGNVPPPFVPTPDRGIPLPPQRPTTFGPSAPNEDTSQFPGPSPTGPNFGSNVPLPPERPRELGPPAFPDFERSEVPLPQGNPEGAVPANISSGFGNFPDANTPRDFGDLRPPDPGFVGPIPPTFSSPANIQSGFENFPDANNPRDFSDLRPADPGFVGPTDTRFGEPGTQERINEPFRQLQDPSDPSNQIYSNEPNFSERFGEFEQTPSGGSQPVFGTDTLSQGDRDIPFQGSSSASDVGQPFFGGEAVPYTGGYSGGAYPFGPTDARGEAMRPVGDFGLPSSSGGSKGGGDVFDQSYWRERADQIRQEFGSGDAD